MRIVFMGTPDFASESLRALLAAGHEIPGVFCQPDRPAGRGNKITYCPVKTFALENGIPVFQPEKMKDGTAFEIIRELQPDLLAVVAFGRMLPDDILAAAPYGAVNVHGSILPKYRGSAPIQWTVINGDELAGVTTMYLGSEMDAGDIIYTATTPVGEYETSGELFDRLKVLGADLLVKTVADIAAGTAPRTPQNSALATKAPMLEKSMSPIDFSKPQRAVIKHIYGMQPWPGATAVLGGTELKIFEARYTDRSTGLAPGAVVSAGEQGIEVACGDGKTVLITSLQAPGKKRMAAADYLRGHKIEAGA